MVNLQRIGYHGATGALSEGAAIELFSNHQKFQNVSFETVPFLDYPKLFEAVAAGNVDHAILPFESSLVGTLQPTLDALAASNLHITGEYVYSEQLCLCGLPGTSVVKEVWSHPSLLEQAKGYLNETFHDTVTLRMGSNSAICAQQLKNVHTAVVCGARAAKLHGLQIIAKDLCGDEPAITRYVLVSAQAIVPERHMEPKTTFAVTLKNTPGAFFKAASCFALRDINITKLDTRPTKAAMRASRPWEYVLYIDVDGSPATDKKVANAAAQLEEFALKVRTLGSYPKYHPPAHKPLGHFGEIGM